MNREKLQLALGIMSGRIVAIAGREQYELLGLEYDPDFVFFTCKDRNWLGSLRRCAEDILLEALCEHST